MAIQYRRVPAGPVEQCETCGRQHPASPLGLCGRCGLRDALSSVYGWNEEEPEVWVVADYCADCLMNFAADMSVQAVLRLLGDAIDEDDADALIFGEGPVIET